MFSGLFNVDDQSFPTSTILIVDDDEGVCNSLSQVLRLERPQFQVLTADSAESASEKLKNTQVDLILTDFRLPKMDGIQLAKEVREIAPGIWTILITAFGTPKIYESAFEHGFIGYLEKPFEVDQLLRWIDHGIKERARRLSYESKRPRDILEALEMFINDQKPWFTSNEPGSDKKPGFFTRLHQSIHGG